MTTLPAPIRMGPPLNLEGLTDAVLDTLYRPASRKTYLYGLNHFYSWWNERGRPPFTRATVQQYLSEQVAESAPASVAVRLAAVRRLARAAADRGWMGLAEAAAIEQVKGPRRLGKRLGRWLTLDQVHALLTAPDPNTLTGKRDRALFALLFGTGMRRDEVINVRWEQVQQRQNRWVIVDLDGKGGRLRSIPLNAETYRVVKEWIDAAGIETGPILRRFKPFVVGKISQNPLSPSGLVALVRSYARSALDMDLGPHDMRRTFAAMSYLNGAPLDVIAESLGHSSTVITRRYLGGVINMGMAAADYLPSVHGGGEMEPQS